MPEQSDERLMIAAGQGDRAAYAQVVERHGQMIAHFIQRFLGRIGSDTVEDLTQDVFMKAWVASRTFTPQAKVSTWLLRITTNTCLNHRRQQRLRRFFSLSGHHADADLSAETAEPAVEVTERTAKLRLAVLELPTNQRAAVVLRHHHGFSYEQIAEVLEVSVSAVESLLFRARKRLQKVLVAQSDRNRPQVSPELGAESP